MFDLSRFRLQDMTACSAALRQIGGGAASIETAADRITRYLYTHLTTGSDETPACVLVRLFKTHPYHRLSPELQTLVDTELGHKPTDPGMKCLTLLGSTGSVSGWNDPAQSSRFRVIPLAGPEALANLPMFSQLFAQFHIDLPFLQRPAASLLFDECASTFNTFHVSQALDSPYVPGQRDFVVPFGVQSVLGFGDLLPTGDLFAVILFTNVPVSKTTADLFKACALSTELALAPFDHDQLILPSAQSTQQTSQTEHVATMTYLQHRVATLESILAVHEQTVEQQSSYLEASLAASLQHAEELQAQSLRFEALASSSPIGIFQTDRTGRCLYTNAACQTIIGRSQADSLGDGWITAIAEEDRARVLCQWEEAVHQSSAFDVEFRVRRPDGAVRWVHRRAKPLRRDRLEAAGHVGTTEDITERKHAEEAVTQSRDMLKSFVEHTPAAVAMLDRDLRYVAVSQRWTQDYRLGEQDIIGKHHYDLFPEIKAMREWQDIHRHCLAGAVERREEDHFVRADGSDEWLRWEVRPWEDGEGAIGGIIMFTEVITERKQGDAARFRLQQAIHHGQDGMALLNSDDRYIYLNPAYAAIFGYRPEELLDHTWQDLFPVEWAGLIEHIYFPALRQTGRWQGEVVGKKKTGEAFDVDMALTLLTDPHTNAQTLLSTCRDISSRKQMERDLINAKDAAEAGARVKAEFIATMSHEIRTPMNGVLGMTGLLLDTALTPEQQEYASTLKHSGESLMRIINDILDFSKIESGKMAIEHIPFDLRLTIEDTLELLAPAAQGKHLELVGLIAANIPAIVVGDPGRIRQILINLIGNAIKFTETGEILVQVMPVDDDSDPPALRFEIVDTGVGLETDAQARLFQSFTQADSSTARKYGGTGLGLAICKRLTELMGGQVGLQSAPGAGTCAWFTIRLETPDAAIPVTAPPIVDNLTGLRICLADDNATNRSLLQYHASAWQMQHESAENGTAALALLRQAAREGRPFDLAIIDMHMPGMDGLQLGHAIREDPALRHTRLVLLTSLGRRGDVKLAESAGFSGYLTKPVRKTCLYDCLRLVMGQPPAAVSASENTAAITLITRHHVAEARVQTSLLVVDDNLINQKVAVKMLEKLGYRVDVAGNGREALVALTRHRYHLVFMDCQMPEMDGFETTRKIRTHERPGSHLPIVAMTANAMAGDREHCLTSGMDDFVSKPVKRQDLQRVLAQWLNQSNDRAAA